MGIFHLLKKSDHFGGYRGKNMFESCEVSTIFPVAQKQLYHAWLDSKEHTLFTGSEAKIDPRVGGAFTAWEGYIWGTTLELEPYHRILQDWRTTEFPEESPNSTLEILLDEVEGGTRITLKHSNIPEGQAENYKQGWLDFYFEPMSAYYSAK
jgi:activator of HSP90 ATPase